VKIGGLLATLRQRDIHLWIDGEHLRCSAPVGALTPDLRNDLQQFKSDLLSFLRSANELDQQQRAIVPLQSGGTRTPIFGTAGHNGDVFCYRALARELGNDQPFFGLQPPGLDGRSEPLTSVEELATYFASQIRAFQAGPCIIAGYCAGGGIAFELAQQLRRDGATIERLALFGSPFPPWYRRVPQIRNRLRKRVMWLVGHARAMASLSAAQRRLYLAQKLHTRKVHAATAAEPPAAPDPVIIQRDKVGQATLAALRRYVPRDYPGSLSLFFPCKDALRFRYLTQWRSVAQSIDEFIGPDRCNGDNMLRDQYAPVFARLFTQPR